MADQVAGNGHAEVSRIHTLVFQTRRLLRSSWVTIGGALTVGLGLAVLVSTTVLDLFMPLPTALRLAACLAVVVPTLLAFVAGVVRPAVRRLSANQVARRIERQVPQMQSRLVTSIDLAAHEEQWRHSPMFFQRLVAETIERVSSFRPSSVVDGRTLRQALVFGAVAVLAFGLEYAVFSDRLPTALARIFLPFADIPPASGVLYEAEPGNSKVLKGDDLTIAAVVKKGEPTDLRLEYRAGNEPWLSYPMNAAEADRFEFTIPQVENRIEYRLVGGGTWTTRYQIDVLERPAITELHTVTHYPMYMKLPEPKVGPSQTGDAAAPEGSDVEIVVAVAGDAAKGEIQLLNPVTEMKPVTDRRERLWFQDKPPAGAAPQGTWQPDFALKFQASHTEAPAAGPHGHGFAAAPVGFEILPGEHLFAYVFIVPGQVPEQIMLQWHDGTGWEHRAYWGADKVQAGAPNTPSRVHMGDVPAAGDWVRLDVSAKTLGLEGKKVTGMLFTLFGGQCKWHRTGAIDPPAVPERVFAVAKSFPMQPIEAEGTDPSADAGSEKPKVTRSPRHPVTPSSAWSGRLPLAGDCYYRVVFANELGYTNKDMKPGKLTAIPDNPPQVTLERPGSDLVLSEPQKVPLAIRAYDDFGLADISLLTQKGDSGGFSGVPLKTLDEPSRSESLLASLDLAPHQLKAGEHVRYRVQVRDRKGQIAQTPEFVVRIAVDNNAADKQLALLTQQQDTFQQKLVQLIAQQAKVTEAVDKLAGRERPAESNEPNAENVPREAGEIKPAPTSTPKVDPAKSNPNNPAAAKDAAAAAELQQKMAELRQELAKLAAPQDANAQLGAQLQKDLVQTTTQLMNSKLVPEQLAAQMQAAQQLFQQAAVQPMREALEAMRQAADPQKPAPDINALADKTESIQRNLEAMKARLEALARAQQQMRNDPAEALAQLRQELMEQNGEMAARELAELRDFLDRMLGQMKMLEGQERELMRQTEQALPVLLPQVETEQAKMEAEAERLLAQADRMAEAENLREMQRRRRQPNFPDAPYTPDGEEMLVPPAEEDTAEQPAEMKGKDDPAKNDKAESKDDEDEEMFMPPTGVRQKLDPRYAKKARPVPKKDAAKAKADNHAQQPTRPQPNDPRAQLMQREQQTAERLGDAQQQLQPRRAQLADLMQQLQQALGLENEQSAQELAELMQSMGMQRAMQLAQAMRQSQAPQQPQGQQPQPGQPPQPQLAQTVLQAVAMSPNAGLRVASEFGENDIDLTSQTVILRMQPRLREELLKGMREEGPEGYRKFIEDYFNRLTKVKSPQ